MILWNIIELYGSYFTFLSDVFVFPLLCIALVIGFYNLLRSLIRGISHV